MIVFLQFRAGRRSREAGLRVSQPKRQYLLDLFDFFISLFLAAFYKWALVLSLSGTEPTA